MTAIGMKLIGADGPRLWNTSMFVLPHTKNLKWLTRLSQRGFSVSTGSACSAGRGNPSRVMAAMGLDFDEMGRVMRVSGGWETTGEDWSDLAAAIREVAGELTQ
jgi:cysteine desulfurase